MRITCIDFETANPFWGSICSIGMAVIEEGKVTHNLNTLVKPHPAHGEFNRDNIRVHGIKPEMVKDAPEFISIYPQLKPYIEGGVVAAHNTAFDIDCLRDVLTIYNTPIPAFEYICTCEIARKSWQGLKNYRLKTVNAFLGHKFKHHDAGEDAMASANIIIKAMEQSASRDIYELGEKLGVKIGRVIAGDIYVLSSVKREQRQAEKVNAYEIKAEIKDFDEAHPFYSKEIVFTGRFLKGTSRRQAMQMAVNSGAKLSNYIRPATSFLVQGAGYDAGDGNSESAKTRKAKMLAETGVQIKIISEDEFFRIVGKQGA